MREHLTRHQALDAVTRYAATRISRPSSPLQIAADPTAAAAFDTRDAAVDAMLRHATQGEVVGHG